MYRPQFAYEHSTQFDDIDFVHYFDFTVVPLLNNPALAPGATILNIPLQLQTDWPFFVRGLQIKPGPTFELPPPIQARFKDPFSHDLSNDFAPLWSSFVPNGAQSSFLVALPGTVSVARVNPLTVVLEPEVRSPAGSVWWVSLRNNTAFAADLTQIRIVMQGVKRRLKNGGGCAS